MAVLIKGKSISCSQKSRDHYLHGKENEDITVLEVSGFATKNADEALQMIELSAKGTRCKKPLYSAKINPEPDRVWTRKEAIEAIDLLEKNLGLTGHARVVVEHIKKGRVHYHALWSRFHPDGGPAKNMGHDYAIHQKTQKEIGIAFKLKPMMARGRDFKDWEVRWAARYGFDIFKIREQITKDFNSVKSGKEFMKKLQAQGIILCRGDKSQFVIILPWGQHKALSSMIHGRPTKTVLRRSFADIDITKLPTVNEGKAQVQAKLPKTKGSKRGHIYIGRGLTPAGSWKPYGTISKPPSQPKTSAHSQKSIVSHDSMQPDNGDNSKTDKTGKGDGAGGGAATAMSALKSDSKSAPPIKQPSGGDIGKGNGPERRRKNMYVAVERRRQGPPKLG